MQQLKDFIGETLRQIIDGVVDSQQHAGGVGAHVNPRGAMLTDKSRFLPVGGGPGVLATVVDFDVAVTTTESDAIKGGIGVFVLPLSLGTQGQAEDTNSTVNRIRFSVPVQFPYQQ